MSGLFVCLCLYILRLRFGLDYAILFMEVKAKKTLNKIFIFEPEITMAGKTGAKSSARENGVRYKTFTTKTYLEDADYLLPVERASERGYPCAYIIHDMDVYLNPDKLPEGKQLGDKDKPHVHTLIRVPNAMTISAFSKRTGVKPSHIQGSSSWRDLACYLLHADPDSIREGKHQYPRTALKGDYVAECLEVVDNIKSMNHNNSIDESQGVQRIIEFVESLSCTLPTSSLVSWCCEHGLYSVYRRSASIIRDVLREHNQAQQYTLQESVLNIRVRQLEARLSDAEKELSRAYGDFFERQKNPWTGRSDIEEEHYQRTIAELNRQIDSLMLRS